MELSIDTASDEIGVALSVDGVAALTATWATHQNQSAELLPNIDRMLREAGRTKDDLTAVFVDIGPGGYAGLRVGVATAKGLAHGLGVSVAGVGRLELDALGVAEEAAGRRIVAVHRAGRGEVAWAAYNGRGGTWAELTAPTLGRPESLSQQLQRDDVLTGDIDDELAAAVASAAATIATPGRHRVFALAAAGYRRLMDGRADDPAALVPLYLRAPAIGPAKRD